MSTSETVRVQRLFEGSATPSKMHHLSISTDNPLTEAFIIDGSLELVARGQQKLDAELPEGTYLVKFRAGDSVTEQYVDLTKNLNVKPEISPVPSTSIPTRQDGGWTEAERKSAVDFVARHKLAVVIRDPDAKITPSDDVSIRSIDGKRILARLKSKQSGKGTSRNSSDQWESMTGSPVVGLGGPAEPGPYLLRVATPGIGTHETTIWVAPNYLTRVYLTRAVASAWGKKRKTAHLGTSSVHLVASDGEDGREAELTEVMRSALSAERSLLQSDEIVMALHGKTHHPMLGLLAAHCLHIRLQNPEANPLKDKQATVGLMRIAIQNLAGLLPGSPDVGALARFYDVDIGDVDFGVPPMLHQSWSLIAPGADKAMIPSDTYACRIGPAVTAHRPWLIWETTKLLETKPAGRRKSYIWDLIQLEKQLRKQPSASPVKQILEPVSMGYFQSPEDLAKSMKMPASSLEESVMQKASLKAR